MSGTDPWRVDEEADELASECGANCPLSDPRASRISDLDAESRSAKTLSIIGFIGAGVGSGAGAALWLLSPSNGEKSGSGRHDVRIATSGGPEHLFVGASGNW